ncbi:MAG: ABC transporter permease [Oscillospiraceae bacterium]|nr:ABC transporter permease [Oscillospiraceae bacterium]
MKRFISDIKRYWKYIVYSARCTLMQDVADSFLGWLWLILNPILFMLVYAFVQICIFENTSQYLAAFLFTGLTVWNFFNASISGSVRTIKRYEGIISKIYVPKFVFLLSNLLVNGFKMLISFLLVLLTLILYQVPFSPTMFWCFPYFLLLFLLTFGLSCILLHIGVFVDDLANIVPIILRMMFFLSGIFYDLEGKLGGTMGYVMERLNPTAHIILQMRRTLLYGKEPSIPWFVAWLIVSLILITIGIHLIYKYERRYVKTV